MSGTVRKKVAVEVVSDIEETIKDFQYHCNMSLSEACKAAESVLEEEGYF